MPLPNIPSLPSDNTVPVLLAATVTCCLAVLHFALLIWGANGYRTLGAGEQMAQAAAADDWRPHAIAIGIGAALMLCAGYALSTSPLVMRTPVRPEGLLVISGGFLFRAFGAPLIKSYFPGNSRRFWIVTSLCSGVVGGLYLAAWWLHR
jgi:hypothetical protein